MLRGPLVASFLLSACLTKANPFYGSDEGDAGNEVTTSTSAGATSTSTSGTSEATGASTTDTSTGADTTAASSTGGTEVMVEFTASIATCTHDGIDDPEACLDDNDDELCIDGLDGFEGEDLECRGHLRFDIDGFFGQSSVTSAELRVTLLSGTTLTTGELWQVECFTQETLTTGWPTAIQMLGPDLGPVLGAFDEGDVVMWPIPSTVFASDPQALCFQLIPSDTDTFADGVDYASERASKDLQPKLVVWYALQ